MSTEKELLETTSALLKALALLKAARCPNCDGSGFTVYYSGGCDMDGENDTRECHQEMCRWCDERDGMVKP